MIDLIREVQAISHLGLAYSKSEYDEERDQQWQQISEQMLHLITNEPVKLVSRYFSRSKKYIAPKVDIRAVVFNEKSAILFVKEKENG